ncbi:Gcp-like domain-containing protein [Amanita rubescens]|nr:Gcp-like domain-containing protein [Amanita rubescens]
MPLAVRQALTDAKVDLVKDIDGVAFTRGPGIGGCLSVGSNAAKSLAAALGKPLIGVHHMQAHALTPLLTTWPNPPRFPFLTLLVSGGHTLLLLAKSSTSFKILATASDESIGRAFDKVSRVLGLNWTAHGPGAALEQFSAEDHSLGDCTPDPIPPFPRPMPGRLAFSYASFHSHAERYIFGRGARAFQEGAVSHLLDKLSLGLGWCRTQDVKASEGLRPEITFVYPPPELCTDNAVMIGWASMTRFLAGDHDDYTIDLRPKWSIEDV